MMTFEPATNDWRVLVDDDLNLMVEFIEGASYSDLPSAVRDKTTEILVDSLACGVGGQDCRAAQIAASLAGAPTRSNRGAVLGTQRECPADLAAFWNTAMIRYLDFNDHLVAGHPSDMLGALLAVSRLQPVSGSDMLTAIAVSYEVHARLVVSMREINTIDRGYSIAIGATAGVSHLLRLDREQTRQAMSMAVTSGLLLRAARAGALSDYKGVASAVAAQFAVFAALLAKGGLTGPAEPLDGRHGLVELIKGEAGSLGLEPFTDWKTLQTCHKFWPVAYNMQPSVWAALELRKEIGPDEVLDIVLNVAPFAWFESGSERDKWDPQTRETADHSLPYAFAHAFEFGSLDQSAFEPSAFRRKQTLDLMKRIDVRADTALGPLISDVVGVRAEISAHDGSHHTVTIDIPRGHHENPMSREEISEKARSLMESRLGDRTEDALEAAWSVASLDSFEDVLRHYITSMDFA
jgi:2-methylcitrate dehydratase